MGPGQVIGPPREIVEVRLPAAAGAGTNHTFAGVDEREIAGKTLKGTINPDPHGHMKPRIYLDTNFTGWRPEDRNPHAGATERFCRPHLGWVLYPEVFVEGQVKVAEELNADGIVFNGIIGRPVAGYLCKEITTCLPRTQPQIPMPGDEGIPTHVLRHYRAIRNACVGFLHNGVDWPEIMQLEDHDRASVMATVQTPVGLATYSRRRLVMYFHLFGSAVEMRELVVFPKTEAIRNRMKAEVMPWMKAGFTLFIADEGAVRRDHHTSQENFKAFREWERLFARWGVEAGYPRDFVKLGCEAIPTLDNHIHQNPDGLEYAACATTPVIRRLRYQSAEPPVGVTPQPLNFSRACRRPLAWNQAQEDPAPWGPAGLATVEELHTWYQEGWDIVLPYWRPDTDEVIDRLRELIAQGDQGPTG